MLSVKRVLQWLIAGSKGGANRARLLMLVKETPLNANKISEELGLDYKTVRHHIDILLKNNLLSKMGSGYGEVFFVSPELEEHIETFNEMVKKMKGVD